MITWGPEFDPDRCCSVEFSNGKPKPEWVNRLCIMPDGSPLQAGTVSKRKLKRKPEPLIRQPQERGGYVGDNYYPNGGVEASHEWDGKKWNCLPGFET